ncbi:MAG: hypothetical protein Q7T19_10840 [Caulobacter sp.]|nr:hypothetical protein [Caulobacter sp.]
MTLLLPLLGVLLGAGLQYLFNRSLEGRRQLVAQKSLAYADYFRSFATIARSGSSKDALAVNADAKTRVCIYGSPRVISRLADFERAGATTHSESERQIVLNLLSAMRRDIGTRRNEVGLDDLNAVLFGDIVRRR